jgi:hypothetical protein
VRPQLKSYDHSIILFWFVELIEQALGQTFQEAYELPKLTYSLEFGSQTANPNHILIIILIQFEITDATLMSLLKILKKIELSQEKSRLNKEEFNKKMHELINTPDFQAEINTRGFYQSVNFKKLALTWNLISDKNTASFLSIDFWQDQLPSLRNNDIITSEQAMEHLLS